MFALVLQFAALVGFPVGGYLSAGAGGAVVGVSVSSLYVGLAVERAGR